MIPDSEKPVSDPIMIGHKRTFSMNSKMAQSALRRLTSFALAALLIGIPLAAAFAQQPTETPAVTSQPIGLTADLSIWGLFWSAHIVVKIVMVGLLVSSIWVWAIVVDKTLLYMRTRQAMD